MVLIVAKWEQQEDNECLIQTVVSAQVSDVRAQIV